MSAGSSMLEDDFSVYLKPTKHAPLRELLRIKIQGAVIQVQVRVGYRQEILDLPAYSLCPPLRDPVDFETPAPAEDMDDIDHLNDQL
ncbi:uncharacterized protein PITG_06125 [Phytophthora infestans T30-4]|uniref:Uncharacterized protein n=1 Tax=Phytophthora infestans (strain T30-4) TaxID=403677 RepID=D0N6G1_PHYIT|nr:uncharacterized protein PITG_06125 [Phytophthora infestans T30-4]EEY70652.1 conserved hypothetical protein [Phytophthora infestans T30-4]|eukprot:XP_002998306.1 conserved hypothetical protein [Phytophthora infestans T30-4]